MIQVQLYFTNKHNASTKKIFVAIQRKHLPAASKSSKLNTKGMSKVENHQACKFRHGMMTLIPSQSASSVAMNLSIGVASPFNFTEGILTDEKDLAIKFDATLTSWLKG